MIAVHWSDPMVMATSSNIPSMHEIAVQVANKYGFSLMELVSERRSRPLAHARQEAYWRCKKETPCSFPQIGRMFGGRDHTTILHGIRQHEKRLSEKATSGDVENG